MLDKGGKWLIGLLAFLLMLLLVAVIVMPIARVCNVNTYTVTITDKGYSGEDDGYIIWAVDENGTAYEFANRDMLLRGKFNSGTVQGALKVGATYELEVVGWRIPFLSEYPNIVDYKLIEN